MTTTVFLIFIVSMIFYGLGEYFSKGFANTGSSKSVVFALLSYLAGAATWLPALKRFNSLSVLGTIWNVGYIIISIVLGVVVFGEVLTTLQIIGLILGIAAIICLSI